MLQPLYIKLVPLLFFFILFSSAIAQSQKNQESALHKRMQTENDLVLLENKNNAIPIQSLKNLKIAVLKKTDSEEKLVFEKRLNHYLPTKSFTFNAAITQTEKLNSFSIVILPIDIDSDMDELKKLKLSTKVIVVVFGEEAYHNYSNVTIKTHDVLLFSKGTSPLHKDYAAQLLFGGIAAKGKLTYNLSNSYLKNDGIDTYKTRLKYTIPEEENLDTAFITNGVDSIMSLAIKSHAFPGAQLLVAKNNKVIFHNTYGYHTYDSLVKVKADDIYDLASVTKITAPLPALMKLYDEGKITLDSPFSQYWKSWKHKKDKNELSLREILAHQAGLRPYIVFLAEVLKNGKLKKRYFRTSASKKYPNQVYDNLFIHKKFRKKVFRKIKNAEVSDIKTYKYSGLPFLIFPKLISELSSTNYRNYLQETFYKPLGAHTLGFTPATKGFKNAIVPTENDSVFRKTLTKNWVHDENAALLGGVSGNAGLFGSANDLAKLMQMYVQYGNYGNHRYITEKTFLEFTKVQYPENKNRRALGFDKPYLNNASLTLDKSYPAPEVSTASFGHAGFTGTFVWADPKNQMIFIFLSNRVYPTRSNRNLYNLNIRPALQQLFYNAKISPKN